MRQWQKNWCSFHPPRQYQRQPFKGWPSVVALNEHVEDVMCIRIDDNLISAGSSAETPESVQTKSAHGSNMCLGERRQAQICVGTPAYKTAGLSLHMAYVLVVQMQHCKTPYYWRGHRPSDRPEYRTIDSENTPRINRPKTCVHKIGVLQNIQYRHCAVWLPRDGRVAAVLSCAGLRTVEAIDSHPTRPARAYHRWQSLRCVILNIFKRVVYAY